MTPRRTGAAIVMLIAAVLVFGCGQTQDEAKKANTGEKQDAGSGEPPNIVFILTDDLDTESAKRMPRLKSLLAERGVTFENAFVTNPTCCPSRATILRGQYTHNHRVVRNSAPMGGLDRFQSLGHESSTLETWLQDAGYRTALFGKYFNGAAAAPTHVPPGWDEWYGWIGSYENPSIKLNENGEVVAYDPERYHDTDVFAEKATDFVERAAEGEKPFFAYFSPNAPHRPAVPAPRHRGAFAGERAPRPPSFDEEDVSDKPRWVRDNPELDDEQVAYIDYLYRRRLGELLAVDEMLGQLLQILEETGELENTYVVFTSDNGFSMGQHRRLPDKWTAYEEDVRVPLIVRGPNVPEGKTVEHMALNNDFGGLSITRTKTPAKICTYYFLKPGPDTDGSREVNNAINF